MKKTIIITLVLVLIFTLAFSLTACNKNKPEPEKTNIVYLGDSICEAIIGPQPLGERDNIGYYAIVGRINDFNYYNHSISGHQTSDGMLKDGVGLLEVLQRDTEDGGMIKTHIEKADIIHISVLGNNALQFDLGWLMLEAANPGFDPQTLMITEDGETYKSLIYYMINGVDDETPYEDYHRESKEVAREGEILEFKFPHTYDNLCDIVAQLKVLNPNAKILFQKVYNPVFEGTTLLKKEYVDELAKITDTNGRFGTAGEKITTYKQIRAIAESLLGILNGTLDRYNSEHPGMIEILDITSYFNNLAGDDITKDSYGAKMLFQDWTHPSSRGHAAIAAATQEWLEANGMANPNALENYKAIKVEQVNRMFSGVAGFDAAATIAAINAGTTMKAVTDAFFEATDPYLTKADYSRNNLSYDRSGEKYFEKDVKFALDIENSVFMSDDQLFALIDSLALNTEECYFSFKKDGTMHAQLQTKDGLMGSVGGILDMLGVSLDGIEDLDLQEAVDGTVVGFFPGFDLNNLKSALALVTNSVGANITGLLERYDTDPGVKYCVDYVQTNKKLPADIFEKLPPDLVLALTLDTDYRFVEEKDSNGNTQTLIYLGKEAARRDKANPFGVLKQTYVKDDNGNNIRHLTLRIEFIGITIALNEII
ncbi:MAG: SGNH/GDSL hydrolase family protein [Clostridia bacterium]|nr:SGNH/GDSL hydrolase family protein [Clostridia bacterium]